MQRIAFWQDTFMPVEQVSVSADDRGYYFGDGVYEVVMAFRGKPYALPAHMDRLRYSLRETRLTCPYDEGQLVHIILEALAQVPAPQVLVYFQVTRGIYPRVHAFPPAEVPGNFLLTAQAYAEDMDARVQGMRAVLREDIRWHRCDVKSLNLLPNVLATQDAVEQGAQTAIFARNGVVTECSSANLFIVREGVLYTHPLGPDILSGTTRADILRLAESLHIRYREEPFDVETMLQTQEVFCTSVATRPYGIVQVEDTPISGGNLGPITMRLQDAYDELILRECP